jgi:hypothetical protein
LHRAEKLGNKIRVQREKIRKKEDEDKDIEI